MKPGTAEGNGIVVSVKLTKKVINKTINLDGYVCDVDGELYNGFDAKITKDGKTIETCCFRDSVYELSKNNRMRAKGAVAKFGDIFLSKASWDVVKAALASADEYYTGDDEYKALAAKIAKKQEEAAANAKKNRERMQEMINNGYCTKCGSYCYGDCAS